MKKGFTLIEVLVTIVLFGLFMLFCFPYLNKVSSNLNDINMKQIKQLEKINIYKKTKQ